jgi:hypothetical protein
LQDSLNSFKANFEEPFVGVQSKIGLFFDGVLAPVKVGVATMHGVFMGVLLALLASRAFCGVSGIITVPSLEAGNDLFTFWATDLLHLLS